MSMTEMILCKRGSGDGLHGRRGAAWSCHITGGLGGTNRVGPRDEQRVIGGGSSSFSFSAFSLWQFPNFLSNNGYYLQSSCCLGEYWETKNIEEKLSRPMSATSLAIAQGTEQGVDLGDGWKEWSGRGNPSANLLD
jgi:hypothetical protein